VKVKVEVEIPDGKFCYGCVFNHDTEEHRHCSYFDIYSLDYYSIKFEKCNEQFKENK